MNFKLESLLEPLVNLAKKAGTEILEVYYQTKPYKIETKADDSPVTIADLKANEVITQGLQKLTPEIPILSEEGAKLAFNERRQWHRYWCVDPLDGTREFISRSGEFTVNIALIEQHQPILGMIYIPVTGECYYACIGYGAYKLNAQNQLSKIQVRSWQTQRTTILASHGASNERMQQYFGFLGGYQLIRVASAWKFCWIAEGKADIYPRKGETCEWDTAAGQCIIEQAGGKVTDFTWQPIRYNMKESLINPPFIVVGDSDALMDKLIKINFK